MKISHPRIIKNSLLFLQILIVICLLITIAPIHATNLWTLTNKSNPILSQQQTSDNTFPPPSCESPTRGKSEDCIQSLQLPRKSSQNIYGEPISFIVYDNTQMAVYYNGVKQFYGDSAEGAFLWADGTVYGPYHVPGGNYVNAYSEISNIQTGSGESNNPWIVTTTVRAGHTGITLVQKVTYVNGENQIKFSWEVINDNLAYNNISLFHAADLYTGNDDYGDGFHNSLTGATGGITSDRTFFQSFSPISFGSKYYEGYYKDVWNLIGGSSANYGFPNSYLANNYLDNGAGLQWNRALPPYGRVILSDYLLFNTQTVNVTCYSLTINPPISGSIEVLTPYSNECPDGKFAPGTEVSLLAKPTNAKNKIDYWIGVDRTSNTAAFVTMNSNRTVGVNFVIKPPVLLVHGILAFTGDTDSCDSVTMPYHYPDNLGNLAPLDRVRVRYFGPLAGHLNENYDVWIAAVDSGPNGTPSLESNIDCLIRQVKNLDLKEIKIVAHSMGGLISRGCVAKSSDCAAKIQSIMTLGSPHAGFSTLSFSLKNQVALPDMSPENMIKFNKKYPNKGTIEKYFFLAGNYIPSILYLGMGDGFISDDSALGYLNNNFSTNPINWDIPACDFGVFRCRSNVSRTISSNLHSNYFLNGSDARPCIDAFLRDEPLDHCAPSTQYLRSTNNQATDESAVSNPVQKTPVIHNSLPGGGSASNSIIVDKSGEVYFVVQWKGSKPTVTLTNPDNKEIDSAFAILGPGIVTYLETPGSEISLAQFGYYFPTAKAGNWKINISNPNAETGSYYTFAQISSPLQLNVNTDSPDYHSGDLMTITATLTDNKTPITGANTTAQIVFSDNSEYLLTLTDLGDGTYQTDFTLPAIPGYATLIITSTKAKEIPFERQYTMTVGISEQTVTFSNDFYSEAIDANSDNSYDRLDVQVGINSSVAGNYILSGELVGASRNSSVGHASTSANLVPGYQVLTLQFDGDDIRQSNQNSYYRLINLQIENSLLGNIPVAFVAEPNFLTAYYAGSSFGKTCFELTLLQGQPTGGILTASIPPNCGNSKYAFGSLVDITATANTGFNFVGWGGEPIGANTTIHLTMDSDKVVVAKYLPACFGNDQRFCNSRAILVGWASR